MVTISSLLPILTSISSLLLILTSFSSLPPILTSFSSSSLSVFSCCPCFFRSSCLFFLFFSLISDHLLNYISSATSETKVYKCIQVMEGVKLGWFEFQGAGVREQKGVSGLDWWLFMQLSVVSTDCLERPQHSTVTWWLYFQLHCVHILHRSRPLPGILGGV